MVRPISFDKQYVKSQDDAHIRNVLLGGGKGVTLGCEITHTSSNITIASGYFCAFGRWLKVEGEEVIGLGEITSEKQYCRLVYTIDLSQANTEEKFTQGKFEIVKDSTNYPVLRQENLDDGGEIYQLEFAQFVQYPAGVEEFTVKIKNIDSPAKASEVGDVSCLNTENKESLVMATNEVVEKSAELGKEISKVGEAVVTLLDSAVKVHVAAQTTSSIAGNGVLTIKLKNLPTSYTKILAVIPTCVYPISTFGTYGYVYTYNVSDLTISVRSVGTTAQTYSLGYVLLYK